MTDRELLKESLKLLDTLDPFDAFSKIRDALRARLAQPEQEPVAWICHQLNKVNSLWWDKNQAVHLNAGFKFTPLYTAPLQQPEQEPVAWITGGGKGELWWHQSEKFDTEGNLIGKNQDDTPLYTAPPQREWQGLTEAERIDIIDEEITAQSTEHFALAQAIEAKLKEKNNG